MKLVINNSLSGFGLSDKAIIEYAKRKGISLYPEKSDTSENLVFYTKPTEERVEGENFVFNPLLIERDDLVLISIVEDLGTEANGIDSKLKIIEIPDAAANQWYIKDYNGEEYVISDKNYKRNHQNS
jgi:hypothetical protein